ncbi:double zinc ribbon domain-containing protein [Acetanaerobacterium elongatum]|uniref:Double zinc ribbon n=1 Tax=Acetanaerobacterium elongatum TaxID=258515 RepID=A0A1H0GL73_9FIRM|nr:zinc ribbon domain-containing protein [Acetanaerobacterium elongatum]SDO07687.1 Double zinc ribbon [Acetanaerobacterium elongatum]
MKTCPQCGELNADDRNECYRCYTPLGDNRFVQKICPKCRARFPSNKVLCERCGARLIDYTPKQKVKYDSDAEWWHYALAIFAPLIGLIMAIVYISRGDDELGKTMIVTVVICGAIQFLLGILFAACSYGML